jgi:hypothetical protein
VPQQVLQLPNLLRQRRLRQVQPPRSPSEMQLLRYGNEVPQVADFDFVIHICTILI